MCLSSWMLDILSSRTLCKTVWKASLRSRKITYLQDVRDFSEFVLRQHVFLRSYYFKYKLCQKKILMDTCPCQLWCNLGSFLEYLLCAAKNPIDSLWKRVLLLYLLFCLSWKVVWCSLMVSLKYFWVGFLGFSFVLFLFFYIIVGCWLFGWNFCSV